MNNKKTTNLLRSFAIEIIISLLGILLIVMVLINKDFSKSLVTNYIIFRPEYSFILLIGFIALFILFLIIFISQRRKKKLKSTKKLSPFAKTVIRSHKVREMSQTQIVYTSTIDINNNFKKIDMPKDIKKTNTQIIDLYFKYDPNLNI